MAFSFFPNCQAEERPAFPASLPGHHSLTRPPTHPPSLPSILLITCDGFQLLPHPKYLAQEVCSRVADKPLSPPSKPDCLCLKSVLHLFSFSLSFMSASASHHCYVFLSPVLLHNLQDAVKAGSLVQQLLCIWLSSKSKPEALPRTGPWALFR